MKLQGIDIDKTIKQTAQLLEDKGIAPALKATIEVLLLLVRLLLNRLGLNSSNSSKSPATDPNRVRKTKAKATRKPGGQKGHKGVNLKPVEDPDFIEEIEIDRRTLPRGKYKEVAFEPRQVVEIKVSRVVTEYRAQVLEDEQGNRYVAEFPEGITRPIQYGTGLKANAVYLSQYQLIPYNRVRDDFVSQMNIPVSSGSLHNFNQEAFRLLEPFEHWVKAKLVTEAVLNADETGVNVGGKRIWLHAACNDRWSYFYPHTKRGSEAMEAMGILPKFSGTLCHDHWKPYYRYKQCTHSLCNAHHKRELDRAFEQDHQQWAGKMKVLLLEIDKVVSEAGGCLLPDAAKPYLERYQAVLAEGDIECPLPDVATKPTGKRGRMKRSTARNLLERLRNYQDDTLRFMTDPKVPFTNNQSENDIRMTKVKQKISGCFRSMEGAYIFCRIRSYLVTCRKNKIGATKALQALFQRELPGFMRQNE